MVTDKKLEQIPGDAYHAQGVQCARRFKRQSSKTLRIGKEILLNAHCLRNNVLTSKWSSLAHWSRADLNRLKFKLWTFWAKVFGPNISKVTRLLWNRLLETPMLETSLLETRLLLSWDSLSPKSSKVLQQLRKNLFNYQLPSSTSFSSKIHNFRDFERSQGICSPSSPKKRTSQWVWQIRF